MNTNQIAMFVSQDTNLLVEAVLIRTDHNDTETTNYGNIDINTPLQDIEWLVMTHEADRMGMDIQYLLDHMDAYDHNTITIRDGTDILAIIDIYRYEWLDDIQYNDDFSELIFIYGPDAKTVTDLVTNTHNMGNWGYWEDFIEDDLRNAYGDEVEITLHTH